MFSCIKVSAFNFFLGIFNRLCYHLVLYRFALIPSQEIADNLTLGNLSEFLKSKTKEYYEHKESEIGTDIIRHVERYIMLQTLDYLWKDHLLNMDHLREGVGLRGYAQKDPLYEYKKDGFDMFSSIVTRFNEEVCEKLFKVQPVSDVDMKRMEEKRKNEEQKMVLGRGEDQGDEVKQPVKINIEYPVYGFLKFCKICI